jgi:predicted flap endonuclease-1-like 5' DNA nuclease
VGQLTGDDDARRAIRAALRGHVRSPPEAAQKQAVAGAGEENEHADAAQTAAPTAEQSQPEQEVPTTTTPDSHYAAEEMVSNTISAEQWLDDIQQGYGALYAPIFTALGVVTVDQVHHLEDAQLTDIVRQLTEKVARRAIRAALIAHVRSPPATEENEGVGALQAVAPSAELLQRAQEVPQTISANSHNAAEEIVSYTISVEHWLDDIQQGYGALYAPIFTALGANNVDELLNLSKSQLRGIVGQLTGDDDARRAIRAALRGHVRSPPSAPENVGVVATTTEENEGPGAAQAPAAGPTCMAEQSQQSGQEELLPNHTDAETTAEEEPDLPIEQWLDSLEHGWGSRHSFIFTDRGFSTLSQLHSMRRGDLQEVQAAMRASGMDQASRRVLRAALRSLLG